MTIASVCPELQVADVLEGLVERVDDPDGEVERQVLGRPVLVGGRHARRPRPGRARAVASSPWIVTPASASIAERDRAGTRRRRACVHQQRLGGVADADALGLGVQQDRDGDGEVGASRRRRRARCRRPVSTTGTVDSRTTVWMRSAPPRGTSTSTRPRACMSATAPSRPHASIDWTRAPGSRCADERLRQDVDDDLVARRRGRAAAQDHRVAALERQARGVDGHVRAGLVDHADHAHRHAHLAHPQAVRQGLAAHDLADRVGQRGELAQGVGDRDDALGGQREPVEQARRTCRSRGRAPGPPRWPRRSRRWPRRARRPSRAAPRPWSRGWRWRACGRRPWRARATRGPAAVTSVRGARLVGGVGCTG